MTIKDQHARGSGELREQAAAWFAQMRGPDADRTRAAFDAWLADDPLHREAYSRIAEVFSLGKGLSEPPRPLSKKRKAGVRRTISASLVVAVFAVGVSGVLLWRFDIAKSRSPESGRSYASGTTPAISTGSRLRTSIGQIRTVKLIDGSVVTLDTATVLDVAYSASRRHFSLLQGRARFDVAHEARPFVVLAATGEVTAHGTLFDVAIQADGTVRVRLLRGKIDVTLPDLSLRRSGKLLSEPLVPGQQVVVANQKLSPPSTIVSPIDERWPKAELDCDHLALSTVAAHANRYSATQIVLAGPALGALQVSGTFRIDNSEILATHLATLFDLHIDRTDPTRLVLRR